MAGCRQGLASASTLSPESYCAPLGAPWRWLHSRATGFTDVLAPACPWEGREQAVASLPFTGLRRFRDVFPRSRLCCGAFRVAPCRVVLCPRFHACGQDRALGLPAVRGRLLLPVQVRALKLWKIPPGAVEAMSSGRAEQGAGEA